MCQASGLKIDHPGITIIINKQIVLVEIAMLGTDIGSMHKLMLWQNNERVGKLLLLWQILQGTESDTFWCHLNRRELCGDLLKFFYGETKDALIIGREVMWL